MTIYKQMGYQMRLPEYETLAEGKDDGYEWKRLRETLGFTEEKERE